MANGIVTPPDYRAANAITGFTEGLKSGVGIVRDVQDIKSRKKQDDRRDREDVRRQTVEGREDVEFDQGQEDRKTRNRDTHIQRVPDYLKGMMAAAYSGHDAEAADIANMVFVPDPATGKAPVKAIRVTKIQAEDGSPTVEIEYEGGKVFQVDPKNAQRWANGVIDGESRTDTDKIKAARYAVDSAREDLKAATPETEEWKTAKAALADAESQYSELTGVKIGKGKGVVAPAEPAAPAEPQPAGVPAKAPGVLGRIKNVFTGELGGPDAAPVATTGPGASAAPKPMTATNKTTGQRMISNDGGKTWAPLQ